MKRAITMALAITAVTAAGCGKSKKADDDKAGAGNSTAPASPAPSVVDKGGAPPVTAGDEPAPAAAKAAFCGADPCPCEPGTEQKHYQTDILSSCKLTRAMELQGYPVKPGNEGGEVAFTKEGKLIRFYLDKEFEVLGYLGEAKTGVELFADGTLKSISLKEPREIQGLPCQGGITFYPGGKLRRCGISREIEMSGNKVQAGDWVSLDKDGKLHRWEVGDRVQKIGKYDCSGYLNYVHPTGELLRCGFAKPVKIEGKKYQAGDVVCFDTAGKVTDCSQFSFDVGGD